jgi:hypothetical protein
MPTVQFAQVNADGIVDHFIQTGSPKKEISLLGGCSALLRCLKVLYPIISGILAVIKMTAEQIGIGNRPVASEHASGEA